MLSAVTLLPRAGTIEVRSKSFSAPVHFESRG
jgi:hypothetical protein